MATSPIILIFLVLSALYAVTKSIYTRINRHQKARALGCLAPKKAPSGFLGWTAYKRGIEAARAFQILDLMWKIHLEHGNTFQRTVLGTSAIVTTEPENIKAILATKFNDFSLGQRNRAFYPLLGDGIFTLDGAGWSHSRTMLRPQFSREQIADVGMLGKHVDQLIALIPRDGSAFDIQDLFFRLTLDTATEFLFGESANSLAVEGHGHAKSTSPGGGALACISDDQDFAEAFNRSLDYLAARTRAQRLYWLVNSSESRKTIKIIHDIVDYYVDKALARRAAAEAAEQAKPSSSSASSSASLASKYIFLDAMVSETQDRKTLRDQMLHLLLAGRDTTASLLSSSFFYLSRHPRVWERLREDILSVFPPPSSFSSSSSSSAKVGDDDNDVDITIARLREVRYLKHFLNEVLRLIPPVPLNSRWAVTDTSLPVGGGPEGKSPVFIHKGQRVMYMINNMHRRRDLWGDDALEFRPERWQGKQGGGGWEYLPFNGGPRICLGQQYALTEASYVLVRLLRRFESVENAQPEIVKPRIRFSLTASHAFGVKVKLFGGEK